jgi:hypothetical protein
MRIPKSAIGALISLVLVTPALGNPAVGWAPASFGDDDAVTVVYQLKPRKQIAGATVKMTISDAQGNVLHEASAAKDFPAGVLTEVQFPPIPALGGKTSDIKLVLKSGIVVAEQVWTNVATRTVTKQCNQLARGSQSTNGADARVQCRWSGFKKF